MFSFLVVVLLILILRRQLPPEERARRYQANIVTYRMLLAMVVTVVSVFWLISMGV